MLTHVFKLFITTFTLVDDVSKSIMFCVNQKERTSL